MANPLNKVSELGDVISRGVSYASGKREQLIRQAINGVLLFIILLVFGCLDFATLKFHGEYLTSIGYWGTVFTKTIAGVCAFNIGINLMWDIEIAKDYILAFAIATYEKLKKWVDDKEFEGFVKIFNAREKKKAYISQINKKIYRLNRLSRAKDRLLYSSDLPENREKKLKNRYCIKRQELEDLKKDEFIDKNLEGLSVKYMEVYPEIFKLEIDGATVSRGVKTKGNVSLGKAKATSSMVFGMIAFSAFVASFGLEMDQEEFASNMEAFLHYLLKCVEDVAIIIWQSLRGALRTKRIISSELTQPYAGRNKVLLDFLKWKTYENNSMSEDEYKKIIDEINSIEINGQKNEEKITYEEIEEGGK